MRKSWVIVGVLLFFGVVAWWLGGKVNTEERTEIKTDLVGNGNDPTETATEMKSWRNSYQKNQIIMTVGEERIFGSDFESESSNPFYESAVGDKKEAVLSKLANDSIILQLAKTEKWPGWVEAVFDREEKDYAKRRLAVFGAEEFLRSKWKTKYDQTMTAKKATIKIIRNDETNN